VAQENGQRFRFFLSAQLNDDLHGTSLADVRSWCNATIANGLYASNGWQDLKRELISPSPVWDCPRPRAGKMDMEYLTAQLKFGIARTENHKTEPQRRLWSQSAIGVCFFSFTQSF
jgi:hypothetical protein